MKRAMSKKLSVTASVPYTVHEGPFTFVFGGCRYDHLDLLFHIFRSLKLSGYQGVPIHNITRDEVQDFTQAELLVDLRCTFHWLHLFLTHLC